MRKNVFFGSGNWYKGNIHCHTTYSDGCLTAEQVIKLYKKNGYDFLAISDHDIFSDYRTDYNSSDFIVLPAIEASAILYEDKTEINRLRLHHMLGILGTEEMQKNASRGVWSHLEKVPPQKFWGDWDGNQAGQKLQKMLDDHGCIVVYNHPVWSRVKENEFTNIQGLNALEIYNYGNSLYGSSYDAVYWDVILQKGIHINGVASDDNHNKLQMSDSFGGYIVVKAQSLDHDAITRSIIAGNYYSSQGPSFYEWGIRNGLAYVECSPVKQVRFIAGNFINSGGIVNASSNQNLVTHAEFQLRGNEKYLRVECTDICGKIAWTNPVYL